MAADEKSPRPADDAPAPVDPLTEEADGDRSLSRRIADRWNGVGFAGKAALVGGAVVAVVGGIILLSRSVASASGSERDDADAWADDADDSGAESTGQAEEYLWTNHAGGYRCCNHSGCAKKANPTIHGHGCCGRCRAGRECHDAAMRDYDGPGSFAHDFFGTWMEPDVCADCGEASEAHPYEYDRIHGERRERAAG